MSLISIRKTLNPKGDQHLISSGLCSSSPWWPLAPYFCSWATQESILISYKAYAGHPGFDSFRALGSLQFFLKHSLASPYSNTAESFNNIMRINDTTAKLRYFDFFFFSFYKFSLTVSKGMHLEEYHGENGYR